MDDSFNNIIPEQSVACTWLIHFNVQLSAARGPELNLMSGRQLLYQELPFDGCHCVESKIITLT
jgi:hypothetical protein